MNNYKVTPIEFVAVELLGYIGTLKLRLDEIKVLRSSISGGVRVNDKAAIKISTLYKYRKLNSQIKALTNQLSIIEKQYDILVSVM